MRAGVYAHRVATGKMKQAVADYQCNALDGAIATLEKLEASQAAGEPGRKELTAQRDELLDKATDLMRKIESIDGWKGDFFATSMAKTLDRLNPEWRTTHRPNRPDEVTP